MCVVEGGASVNLSAASTHRAGLLYQSTWRRCHQDRSVLFFMTLIHIQITEFRVDNCAFQEVLFFKLVNLDTNIGVFSA